MQCPSNTCAEKQIGYCWFSDRTQDPSCVRQVSVYNKAQESIFKICLKKWESTYYLCLFALNSNSGNHGWFRDEPVKCVIYLLILLYYTNVKHQKLSFQLRFPNRATLTFAVKIVFSTLVILEKFPGPGFKNVGHFWIWPYVFNYSRREKPKLSFSVISLILLEMYFFILSII